MGLRALVCFRDPGQFMFPYAGTRVGSGYALCCVREDSIYAFGTVPYL